MLGRAENFRLWDTNHAPFKLNGQSRTAFGFLKAPELQRLSVTVEVLRIGVIRFGVMTVGVSSVGVMTLSHFDRGNRGWSDRGSRSESGLVVFLVHSEHIFDYTSACGHIRKLSAHDRWPTPDGNPDTCKATKITYNIQLINIKLHTKFDIIPIRGSHAVSAVISSVSSANYSTDELSSDIWMLKCSEV